MYINIRQNRLSRSFKTVHTDIFAKIGMLHKFATTNSNLKKMIISDMHHRITYMHANFQQNVFYRPVKIMHTNLFAKNGILHKFATANSNLKKNGYIRHASSHNIHACQFLPKSDL